MRGWGAMDTDQVTVATGAIKGEAPTNLHCETLGDKDVQSRYSNKLTMAGITMTSAGDSELTGVMGEITRMVAPETEVVADRR
jgi:hypothetical protein